MKKKNSLKLKPIDYLNKYGAWTVYEGGCIYSFKGVCTHVYHGWLRKSLFILKEPQSRFEASADCGYLKREIKFNNLISFKKENEL